MNKPKRSIVANLIWGFLLIVLLPLLAIGYLWVGNVEDLSSFQPRFLLWSAAACGLGGMFIYFAYSLLRQRITLPLQHFHSTLEDISEGFIVDEIPQPVFHKAEPGISAAFARVIQINHQMLKTVDNLEKGFEEERAAKLQQSALTQAYERFVPHEFIRFLQKKSIIEVQHGDHVLTNMSILFADIRSFAALSERLSPEENFKLLNTYFMRMEPIVQKNNGFIDKFIGDGIMALFHKGADDALRAAMEMVEELQTYNKRRVISGYDPIQVGIGINTGSLMLGIVGGMNRMEGTVISDAVNVASRIEDLNKEYGTSLLISEFTYNQLLQSERVCIRLIDKVFVKGKVQPLLIYEVFQSDPAELKAIKQQYQAEFEHSVGMYHQKRIAEARSNFMELSLHCSGDNLSAIYLERCLKATLPNSIGKGGEQE